ncbi:PAS domain S-box protein [Paenibacillus sp. LHD-38]|uniref:PAS domain S-box protein n=1 Tax=Paenibacillus sp. LHD-38 TaxID=3072143 RepID=UPI00280E64F7|nr:PAS domain S-box protein [Paenibacillus sp. LHD-38]MDQ8737175.1 PAS domain S-box protein [Paenibacillus sp. LHD-38]
MTYKANNTEWKLGLMDDGQLKADVQLSSEDIFRNAFEYSTNGVAIVAPNGRWLKVNRSFCHITGYSEEELLSLDFQSITHPDDLERSRKYAIEMMNGQTPFLQMEKRYIHKLGHSVWVMLSSNLCCDAANNPLYFISQIVDITAYKCTTDALFLTRQELKDTVRMQQGMTFKFKQINDRFVHTLCDGELLYRFGLIPEQVVGKQLIEFLPSALAAQKEKYYRRAWEGEENVIYEGEFGGIAYLASLRPVKRGGKVEEVIASCVDITERKVMEQQYSSLFEYHPNAIVSCDLNGRILSCNLACEKIVGYRKEELLHQFVGNFFEKDEWDKAAAHFRKIADGKPNHFDIGAIHKAGDRIELNMTSVPLVVNDEIVGLHLIIKDITEQKRTQEELTSTKELLESFFRNMDEAIVIFEPSGNILKVNKAFESIYGWKSEEVVGCPLPEMPDEFMVSLVEMSQKIKLGEQVIGHETIHRAKNGELIHVSLTLSPIRDVKGGIVAFASIIRDITEQKQAEKVLRENDQRYRQLIKLLPEPIVVHSEGIFVYLNDAGITLVGAASQEEIVGQSIFEFIHPDFHHQAADNIKQVTMGSSMGFSGYKFVRMNGEVIEVEACSTKVNEYMGRSVIQTVIRDITERKRTEELLRKSDKLSAVGQLAAGVAHEIRNPLTAIKGFVQLLQSRTKENRDYFDIMLSELERINYIVSEFMLLAKPAQIIHFEQKDIRKLVQSILSLLDTQAIMNNVQIQTEIDPDIQTIMCEENQLKQVFVNVIKNAIEAMPNGGLLVIQVKHKNKCDILIRFIDQGCGIPKEGLPKLGEPFYSTKEKGNGLGLMMCYKIVEAHHGHMYIKSKPGKGTTIDVILPGA